MALSFTSALRRQASTIVLIIEALLNIDQCRTSFYCSNTAYLL